MDPAQVVAVTTELSPAQSILSEVVKGIAGLAGVALTAALSAAFTYLREKRKIEIRKDTEQRILGWIPLGIARAEEWAQKKIKDPNDNDPITGEMKQEVAIKTVQRAVPEFEQLPVDTRAALIDAKLNQLRRGSILPPPLSIQPPPLPSSTLQATPGTIPKAAATPRREP